MNTNELAEELVAILAANPINRPSDLSEVPTVTQRTIRQAFRLSERAMADVLERAREMMLDRYAMDIPWPTAEYGYALFATNHPSLIATGAVAWVDEAITKAQNRINALKVANMRAVNNDTRRAVARARTEAERTLSALVEIKDSLEYAT